MVYSSKVLDKVNPAPERRRVKLEGAIALLLFL